jgi:type I restriction enzyme S subunit
VDELMKLCDELEGRVQRQREARERLSAAALDRLLAARDPAEFARHWQRLGDHFDLLYDAPETLAQLRQAILQLAVQGSLVPQDPSDEPADVLRRRILRAKSGWLEAGSKTVVTEAESIEPSDELFPTPSGWTWARVADVFDVSGGITKNPTRAPAKNHFPYLRVANVQRSRLDLAEIERFELFEGELDRWRLQPQDLLVVEGNGSEQEIGRCAIWSGEIADCVHQNHIIRCRPIEHQGSRFTLMFLNSPTGINEMTKRAITTSGLYSLSVGKIRSLVIPLPPEAEQRRIVAKVDHLMSLCDALEAKLKQAQTDSDRLLAAAVQRSLDNRANGEA